MQSSPLQRICDRIANEHRKQACSKHTCLDAAKDVEDTNKERILREWR